MVNTISLCLNSRFLEPRDSSTQPVIGKVHSSCQEAGRVRSCVWQGHLLQDSAPVFRLCVSLHAIQRP